MNAAIPYKIEIDVMNHAHISIFVFMQIADKRIVVRSHSIICQMPANFIAKSNTLLASSPSKTIPSGNIH